MSSGGAKRQGDVPSVNATCLPSRGDCSDVRRQPLDAKHPAARGGSPRGVPRVRRWYHLPRGIAASLRASQRQEDFLAEFSHLADCLVRIIHLEIEIQPRHAQPLERVHVLNHVRDRA